MNALQTLLETKLFRQIEELKQAYDESREYIDQLEFEKYEKDSEIEGLRDESKLATEAFNQNADLKQRVNDMANAVDAYLAVDGFHHPIEGMELQRARLTLRSVTQQAREVMER